MNHQTLATDNGSARRHRPKPLTHKDLFRAFEVLARDHNLSVSGMAVMAGLDATALNPSKRINQRNGRPAWPSTETLFKIVNALHCNLFDFAASIQPETRRAALIPSCSYSQVMNSRMFGKYDDIQLDKWDVGQFYLADDERAYALAMTTDRYEPLFRQGATLVISPSEKCTRDDRVIIYTKNKISIGLLGDNTNAKVTIGEVGRANTAAVILKRDIVRMHKIIWTTA